MSPGYPARTEILRYATIEQHFDNRAAATGSEVLRHRSSWGRPGQATPDHIRDPECGYSKPFRPGTPRKTSPTRSSRFQCHHRKEEATERSRRLASGDGEPIQSIP